MNTYRATVSKTGSIRIASPINPYKLSPSLRLMRWYFSCQPLPVSLSARRYVYVDDSDSNNCLKRSGGFRKKVSATVMTHDVRASEDSKRKSTQSKTDMLKLYHSDGPKYHK